MNFSKNRFLPFITGLFILILLAIPTMTWAKDIKLYEGPKEDAKIIGTIDLSKGVIPIISSTDGTWMKVGDPKNGNVGWIKSDHMGNGASSSFTFTQRMINTGKGPQTYQVIQYGNTDNNNDMLKKIQKQQQSIRENMQKTIQSMVNEINALYQQETRMVDGGTPIIMPIVIFPSQKSNTPNKASDKSQPGATAKPNGR